MNPTAASDLDGVLAVMGQGIREYVVVLDRETLRVSKTVSHRSEGRRMAEQIVRGNEAPLVAIPLSDIASIVVRQGRVVVDAGGSTVVLPMLGRAGVWTSQRRSVVIGDLEGRPVASAFAQRLATASNLPLLEPDRWGRRAVEATPTVAPVRAVIRLWSPLQSLSRALFGIGFAVLLARRLLTDASFASAGALWFFVPVVLVLLLFGLRSLAIGLRVDAGEVVVRNVGRTHRIPAASIARLTLSHHRAVRSVFTDRPLIAFREHGGRVVGAQASISVSGRTARRLVHTADEIASLLGVPNDLTLGGLSDDRLGDDGQPVVRAGRPF